MKEKLSLGWLQGSQKIGRYEKGLLYVTYIPQFPHPCLGQALLINISNLDWMYRILDPASQLSSVQSLSRVRLFVTLWIAARQASLSITNSRSSLRLTSIESVMPSSRLILCSPLLLLPPIPPSIRVFSNESALQMRWPKYWSFSFSIIPSKEIPGLISFRMDWLDLLRCMYYSIIWYLGTFIHYCVGKVHPW